jgi:hypothetical protein
MHCGLKNALSPVMLAQPLHQVSVVVAISYLTDKLPMKSLAHCLPGVTSATSARDVHLGEFGCLYASQAYFACSESTTSFDGLPLSVQDNCLCSSLIGPVASGRITEHVTECLTYLNTYATGIAEGYKSKLGDVCYGVKAQNTVSWGYIFPYLVSPS